MLSVSPATRVFVALNPVDMRRSFNGLYAQVQSVLKEDPLSGHLFCFRGRRSPAILLAFSSPSARSPDRRFSIGAGGVWKRAYCPKPTSFAA